MFIFGIAAAVSGTCALLLMLWHDRTYVPSAPFAPSGAPNVQVVVVYYSRTGHTEAVAREVARTFNAPIARIDADYPRDIGGQSKALKDANAAAIPAIRVATHDLASAKQVFLVSPTWLFRPAPPLWAYVEQADLSGKEVVLIMTGNSRYKQDEIDAFARRIESRGGLLTKHIFLRRGRIFWQKSREQLLSEVRAAL